MPCVKFDNNRTSKAINMPTLHRIDNRFGWFAFVHPRSGERYIWTFRLTEKSINDAIRTVIAFAGDSDMDFDYDDAARINGVLRTLLVRIVKSKQGGSDGGVAN